METKVALHLKAENWRAFEKNTLQGFVDLEVEEYGLVIRGACLHAKNGKRWVSLPAKPWTDKEGNQQWQPVVEFVDNEARDAFQRAAVPAIDKIK